MRRLRSGYAGPLIKVRRASDNALLDIYAGSDGWVDEAAIIAHCGASIGTIDTWYSQDDVGRHFVQATTSRQYQIYDGTAVRKKNSKPAAYVTVEDSGYWVNFPTYTDTQVSGCLVASLTTTAVTGETAAARFLSLLDTSSNNDISSTARAILIGRQGGSSPTSNWGTRRSSTWYATTASAGVDTLDQVVTIYTGAQAQLYRRNGTPVTATSTVAFNIGRLGLGFAGASTYVSCPGAYISEGWFWRDDIDATDRDELYSDQSVAFALS
jgi:Alpha-L-arabinofuranosidase B, catalytic